ncbi:hypothetical protein PR048_022513 [Dryococelus australis]|uniref:Uncharacterized protein n=1 Tax=Dryococelus australis TaxID=614101 RepID=A0ABQ9H1A3_9NEOP|nr:hypothetical protein PR048_022513 [Dryococelus australis]
MSVLYGASALGVTLLSRAAARFCPRIGGEPDISLDRRAQHPASLAVPRAELASLLTQPSRRCELLASLVCIRVLPTSCWLFSRETIDHEQGHTTLGAFPAACVPSATSLHSQQHRSESRRTCWQASVISSKSDCIRTHVFTEAPARLPPRRTVFDPRAGSLLDFAAGNHAGRCRWSAGFLGDIPVPPHPALSFRRCSILTSLTLIGSEDLDGRGKRECPDKGPPASGIVQHDSHMRGSGSEPAGDRAWIAVVGGEYFLRVEAEQHGRDKGDSATPIKCAIAAKRKAMNRRVVFWSCCVYPRNFQRSEHRIIISLDNNAYFKHPATQIELHHPCGSLRLFICSQVTLNRQNSVVCQPREVTSSIHTYNYSRSITRKTRGKEF